MITSWPGTRGDIPGKHFAGISCILIILATGCAIPAFAGQPPHHFTETVVSVLTPDSDQDLPFIFENGVVFIDFRNGTAGVRTYDPATGNEEMISGTFSPTQFSPPSASGDRIAWESFDGNEAFICLYNASSGDRVILANLTYQLGSYPVIRGDLVAYSDYSGTDLDIHIIDLHLGETLVLDNGTESTDDSAPDICGDTVVWQGVNRAGGDSDIYLWKIGTPDIRDLTTGTPDILQAYPDIDGNYVVWQGYDRLNNTYDIYLHDLAGNETTLLTPGTSYTDERNPKISGDCIVWQCLNISTSVNEIVFYSISSEELVPVSIRGHGEQYDPSIYGDRIAWSEMDAMSGKFDICMATHGIQAPPLVPSFDANKTAGSVPLAVQFHDRSSGDPTGWWWDFGDGDYSREQNPGHVYTRPGMYPVMLIVNTPYRREGFCVENMVVVGSPPFVEFQGEPVYGIAPLEVQFSDLSSGNPSEWLWDFGDGDTSAEKNPMHAYISPGLYNVTLASGNDFWGDTTEKTGYIAVMQGYKQDITFSIEGITLDEEGGRQVIALNDTVLGGELVENETSYLFTPVPGHNITSFRIDTPDGLAFSRVMGGILEGEVGAVNSSTLEVRNGSPSMGWALSTRLSLSRYPQDGRIIMTVWPGVIPGDLRKFQEIATRGNPNDADWATLLYGGVEGVAFTARFQCDNGTGPAPATLIFGISPEWIEENGWRRPVHVASDPDGAYVYIDGEFQGYAPLYLPPHLTPGNHTLTLTKAGYPDAVETIVLEDKRNSIHVVRISDDGTGEVLPAAFLYHDSFANLDYFRVDSRNGLSTFGIVSTSSKENPLQMFYLTLSKVISLSTGGSGNSGSGSGGGGGSYGGSGSLQLSTQSSTPAPTVNAESPKFSQTALASVSANIPAGTVAVPATTIVKESHPEAPVPENPLAVRPSGLSISLVRSLTIVFGIILATTVIILRMKRRA